MDNKLLKQLFDEYKTNMEIGCDGDYMSVEAINFEDLTNIVNRLENRVNQPSEPLCEMADKTITDKKKI